MKTRASTARQDLHAMLCDEYGLDIDSENPPLTDAEMCARLAAVDASSEDIERAQALLAASRMPDAEDE